MKTMFKKSFALFMVAVMCISVLFGMNLSAFAADNNTVDYVYSGNYVYNWGEREEEATFLSPMAIKFYSDNNVSLSELLTLSGSSTESGVPSSALYRKLHELMESNHSYTNSYDAVKNLCKYTDCQNSGGKISSFYSGKEIGPEWNSNEWNREHTWPNSKGDKAGNGENDIMMLRPTASSENSSRGNKAYGTETTTQYYNPNDEGDGAYDLRGDVARILLYQYVRWECTNTGSKYNSTGIFGGDGVIESKDVLLDWIEADPVDTWELGRNDAVEAITGTRNVFVDYPELAFDLFNEDVPADYTSPSDGTSVEGTTGTGGSDNTDEGTDDTTSTPGAEIVFNLGANGAATHSDGSSKTSYTETADGYTLNITGGSSFYTGARDAKGNSAIKMGTSSKTGSFSLTAPDDVIKVIFNVAGYKAKSVNVNINGTAHSITTTSDSGAYTAIEVDTASTKNITFATSTNYRCMIDSITFVVAGSSDDTTDENKDFVKQDGLVISGPGSAFDENVVVTATKLTVGDDFNTAQTALADKASQFTLYDITATVGGTAVQPSGEITITLDIPNGYDPDYVCIAYISDDGTVQELESSSVDKAANTVSATLEHFSLYAVIDTSNVSTDDGDDSGDDNTQIVEVEATINFTTTTQRISQDSNSQVWSNDGFTFTNNKAGSSNAVADYSNPVRLYKGSSVTLEFSGITKIYIESVSGYSDPWVNSIDSNIAIATKDGNNITITLKESADTFTITSLTAQARAKSITVYGTQTITGGGSGDDEYTISAQPNNSEYGTVEVSGDYIIATPADGYKVAGCEIVSGNTNATVTQNGNNFTVVTTADVTIQINFVALPTYTIQFSENGTVTSTQSAYEGAQITLPEHDTTKVEDGYEFVGWATVENATSNIKAAGDSHTVTANATFYAQYKESGNQTEITATIIFDDASKRIVGTTSQQKWVENGITVTNDKAASTSNVNTSYVKPIRVYASSSLTVEYPGMTKIEITANTAAYATVVLNSISNSNATVIKNDKIVTVTFASAVDSFVIAKLTEQTRLDSITVYATQSATPSNEYTVTYIENGTQTSSTTVPEGTDIMLQNDTVTPDDKNFVGWATVENATSGILEAGSSYKVTADVTFYAQYTDKIVESADHYFVKVTEDQTDWTGTYLIVYEEGGLAFNGSLTSLDVASNYKSVEINDGKIAATANNMAIVFVVTKNADGTYSIRSKSGFNIGGKESDENGILTNATKLYNNSISIDADGNAVIICTYKEFNNYMRYNATSNQKRFRYFREGTYSNQKPIALYKLDVAEVSGARVMVGSDLSIDYYVNITNAENVDNGDLSIRFTVDGDETSTTVDLDKSKIAVIDGVTYYVFTFAGLAPQRMTDNIKAELLLGDTVVDTLAQYSVQQNAINLLADNPSNELIQFITDMLYYGEAAQNYTKYNTDKLATSGVTGLGTPSTATPDDSWAMSLTTNTTPNTVYFRAATVWFDTENGIIVKLNDATNATLKVNGENVTLDGLQYMISGIKATEFDTVYTFELYENDVKIQTLTYSINAYAYSKQNSSNTNMANLALALYRFGKSADTYSATL